MSGSPAQSVGAGPGLPEVRPADDEAHGPARSERRQGVLGVP